MPDHTSCKEIFDGYGLLIRNLHADVDTNFGRIMPCPDDNHFAEILGEVYDDREKLAQVAQACYERVTDSCFEWASIAEDFNEVFQEVLADKKPEPVIREFKSKRKKKTKEVASPKE